MRRLCPRPSNLPCWSKRAAPMGMPPSARPCRASSIATASMIAGLSKILRSSDGIGLPRCSLSVPSLARLQLTPTFFGHGNSDGLLGSGQHDSRARARYTHLFLKLFGQQVIEVLSAAATDLEQIVVIAGDVVAFGHLVHFFDGPQERGAVAMASEGDGDIGGEGMANGRGVDKRSIPADDAALLQLVHAFRGRRRGEAEELAELGPGGAPSA